MPYTGPINPDPQAGETLEILYGYVPSRSLSAVAALISALVGLAHFTWFLRLSGTRAFQFFLVLGCLMEVVGYGFRTKSHYTPYEVTPYVAQFILIVTAPVFFAGAMYYSLSKTDERIPCDSGSLLPIKPKLFLIIFTVADVISTVCQLTGAGLIGAAEQAAANGRTPRVGTIQANNILIAGLASQTAFFAVFLGFLAHACWVSHRRVDQTKRIPFSVQVVVWLASLLIFMRTIFRLVETTLGLFSYPTTHEALFAGLEFVPIVFATTLLAFFPLGEKLPGGEHVTDAQMEETPASTPEAREASDKTLDTEAAVESRGWESSKE